VTFGSGGRRSIQLSYERAEGGGISRVLLPPEGGGIISLGPPLPTASSSLPGTLAPALRPRHRGGPPLIPYLALLRVGFTMPRLLPDARCALTAPFHPCLCLAAIGGVLSVALSVASRRPGVTRHPALWSSDFPRWLRRTGTTAILTRLPTNHFRNSRPETAKCPGEDSNLHAVSGTRSLVWPVYQFQHLGNVYDAPERTRTSTGLRPLDPESSASTSSATGA
jgi:hypothetical protein